MKFPGASRLMGLRVNIEGPSHGVLRDIRDQSLVLQFAQLLGIALFGRIELPDSLVEQVKGLALVQALDHLVHGLGPDFQLGVLGDFGKERQG